MTDEPNLRARALDAAAQALNAGGYWLPTDGQAAVVDAILALCAAEIEQRIDYSKIREIGVGPQIATAPTTDVPAALRGPNWKAQP